MMQIYLNGAKQTVDDHVTVEALLKQFDIKQEAVVVELNRNILDRQKFPAVRLRDQDVLEVVQFVGGG